MDCATTPRPRLTWALMLCTYNRPDMLRRCVKLALEQTRPPVEVVVVDASAEWAASAQAIRELVERLGPGVRLTYEQARVRSITHQRNQGIVHVTADVVFAIDDDSLMRLDCAEQVLRIYQHDTDGRIAAVAICTTDVPPDEDPSGAGPPADAGSRARTAPPVGREGSGGIRGRVRGWFESQLHMERLFVPYRAGDSLRHRNVVINGMELTAVRLIGGFRMTFRRRYGPEVGWCEALRYYALHEDADFSYRLSSLGLLVVAPEAILCHCQAPGGRLSLDRVARLRALNLLALHRARSPDRRSSALRIGTAYLRLAALYLVIDAARRRFTFPTARAYLFAVCAIPRILGASDSTFPGGFHRELDRLVHGR